MTKRNLPGWRAHVVDLEICLAMPAIHDARRWFDVMSSPTRTGASVEANETAVGGWWPDIASLTWGAENGSVIGSGRRHRRRLVRSFPWRCHRTTLGKAASCQPRPLTALSNREASIVFRVVVTLNGVGGLIYRSLATLCEFPLRDGRHQRLGCLE